MSNEKRESESVANPVMSKLTELGVDPAIIVRIQSELGAEQVTDLSALTESDLTGVGMKPLAARRLVASLVVPEPRAEAPTVSAAVSFDMLPSVPSDESWLDALRAGGVLKVDQSTVISAIRAALAKRVGLFDIPAALGDRMEQFADENEEQVDPEFFKLRRQLTRRSYADIFAAIDGLDGSYVTEARKKQLFERINKYMWPAIIEFNVQLKSWQEAWMQGSVNPGMMMAALMAGGSGMAMPPGMMSPPDTGILRDTADAVADAVNKVFAGTGVQIAAALAYDAAQIKTTLENPRLPALIGAANREQMLRQLGVAVSATYPRLETNLTRFVLSTMRVKDQPSGNEELQYFGALFMLGSQIPWNQLGENGTSGSMHGIGGRTGGRNHL